MTVVAEAVTVEVASVAVLVAADVVVVAVAVEEELDWASPSPINKESAPSTAGRGSNMAENVQDVKSRFE